MNRYTGKLEYHLEKIKVYKKLLEKYEGIHENNHLHFSRKYINHTKKVEKYKRMGKEEELLPFNPSEHFIY